MLQSNVAEDSTWQASHLHNLSRPHIATDINPRYLRFETVLENQGSRKKHQSGRVPCNHSFEIRCRFGVVEYVDKSWVVEKTDMSEGPDEWVRKQLSS